VRRAIEIMEMLQGTYEVQFHRRRSTSSRQTYVVKSHLPKEVFGSVSCLDTQNNTDIFYNFITMNNNDFIIIMND